MAGYRPVEMVRTPWGDADTLRDRKLRPGQRLPAGEVARNQRERLFAALVAVVAEKGYEGTRVEDLLELSGVSRSAFYEHFGDKQDCLLAAVEAFVGPAIGAIGAANGQQRARSGPGRPSTRWSADRRAGRPPRGSASSRSSPPGRGRSSRSTAPPTPARTSSRPR